MMLDPSPAYCISMADGNQIKPLIVIICTLGALMMVQARWSDCGIKEGQQSTTFRRGVEKNGCCLQVDRSRDGSESGRNMCCPSRRSLSNAVIQSWQEEFLFWLL
ncbi:uncharacterized protein LOC110986185 isoform X2 [Acanthaster planci]|uniref:Uncharacterized protein LOC110986185 isoform X2 n=1 Tax=Acanthaster planci TaxID=133434 RepID=A0A8B7ZCZ1_ACAPL|nr:uncharacterized protein LOC110986185 isoform X2 [Acanthaster planci]